LALVNMAKHRLLWAEMTGAAASVHRATPLSPFSDGATPRGLAQGVDTNLTRAAVFPTVDRLICATVAGRRKFQLIEPETGSTTGLV
jgi:hypothetical protein